MNQAGDPTEATVNATRPAEAPSNEDADLLTADEIESLRADKTAKIAAAVRLLSSPEFQRRRKPKHKRLR